MPSETTIICVAIAVMFLGTTMMFVASDRRKVFGGGFCAKFRRFYLAKKSSKIIQETSHLTVSNCERGPPRKKERGRLFTKTPQIPVNKIVVDNPEISMEPSLRRSLFVAITGMFLGTTLMFLASAVLCQQATALVLG